MTDTIVLTERQADTWRTTAAVIHNAINETCGDLRLLMIREGDRDYPRDVGHNVMYAFYLNADALGITGPMVDMTRRLVHIGGHVDPDLAVYVTHEVAHCLASTLRVAMGDETTRAQAQRMIDRFAIGDFGPEVEVE